MWFYLALASAILGAIEIAINKHSLSKITPAVLLWGLLVLSIPPLIPLAIKEGVPSINTTFWIAIIGSTLTYLISRILHFSILRENLISKIIPLTAFSGVFIYLIGLALLSETIRPIPLLGLFLTVIGAYILNTDQAKEDILKPFKLLFSTKSSLLFLLAIFLVSITAVFDKMAVINTIPEHPIFTIFVEQVLMSVFLTLYLIKKQNLAWIKEVKKNFWVLLLNSLISLAIILLVFYAYTEGPVSLVIGIKRLQIFFVLILGYLFLKDKPTKHSWIASTVMITGAILIKIG